MNAMQKKTLSDVVGHLEQDEGLAVHSYRHAADQNQGVYGENAMKRGTLPAS